MLTEESGRAGERESGRTGERKSIASCLLPPGASHPSFHSRTRFCKFRKIVLFRGLELLDRDFNLWLYQYFCRTEMLPLPPAYCLLPLASCLLPPASCLLPPASCLIKNQNKCRVNLPAPTAKPHKEIRELKPTSMANLAVI